MRIKNVIIKNYHSIVECEFEFKGLLALIGKNNCGKSNIIYALNLFLGKEKPRDIYSFHNPELPIEITIEFIDLTPHEKENIPEHHRENDSFILKKIYTYIAAEGEIEKRITSVKNGEDTNIPPRGLENVLADLLPELYLLPAIKYPSEETKFNKTTNFGKFLNLLVEKFENDFSDWKTKLDVLNQEISRSDAMAPMTKMASELSSALKEQFSDSEIKLQPKVLSWQDTLKDLEVLMKDDVTVPLINKGQGSQRAFIFAILRLLAKALNEKRPSQGKAKKGLIIAIEEPELYLHPQQEKIVYSLLKSLSQQAEEQIQVIYATHSSFMVHIEDYQFIGILKKKNITEGTKIFQYTQEIFSPDSKKEFQLLCQFDPERNELFFAEKVIFVEGDTEKFSLPVIFDKIGFNPIEKGISIIECGSKGGIKLFLEVANKFNRTEKVINYIVFHDKDIPWKDNADPKIIEKEKQAGTDNSELATLSSGNPIYEFTPDFERELSLGLGDESKPYRARKQLLQIDLIGLPEKLKEFIISNL